MATHQLNQMVEQLPSPCILMGDFNSHSTLCGGHTKTKGRIIEKFIYNNDLCLLNDGSNTYLHPAYGTYSAIDLTLCEPEIRLIFQGKYGKISVGVIIIH